MQNKYKQHRNCKSNAIYQKDSINRNVSIEMELYNIDLITDKFKKD